MSEIVCHRYLISGRVQGVFFRESTVREATSLGLRGWAINLPDGKVEVLAVGPLRAVETIGVWLHRGPPTARVDAVNKTVEAVADFTELEAFRSG
jgi:acylphosphatase